MAADPTAEILDLLYSAVTDGDLWPLFLERFTDAFGGNSAWLSHVDLVSGGGSGIVSRMDPAAQATYFDRFVGNDPLSGSIDASTRHPLVFNDEQLIAKQALTRTAFYNEFMRRIDVHSVLMIRLWAEDGRFRTLNLNRSGRRDQFDGRSFDIASAYRPHLVHAASLSQKLAQAEIHRLGAGSRAGPAHGILLLDHRGRVVYADPLAEALLAEGEGLSYANGRLGAVRRDAGERLEHLVRAAVARGPGRAGGMMTVPRRNRRLPLLLQVGPVRSRLSPFYAEAAAVVTLTDLNADQGLPEPMLRATFGLTGAEARVAAAIAGGQSPKEIAERSGLGLQTIRSQLQRAYDKTGTRRQVELTLLLTRLVDRWDLHA